jgi:hypothetical protein
MRIPVIVGLLLVASGCAQAQAVTSSQAAPSTQTEPAATQPGTITIPQGTRIPLALSAALTTKAARRGATVRAVTTFPVTVGAEVAIPVGTYVEGTIDKVKKSGRTGPSMQVHFTRMVFANGYSVTVNADNTEAQLIKPESSARVYADGFAAGGIAPHYVLAAQTTPPPPTLEPLPQPPTHEGVFIGVAIGSAIAGIVALVLLVHHNGGAYNGIVFDSGWQFEMVLQSPVSLSAADAGVAAGA